MDGTSAYDDATRTVHPAGRSFSPLDKELGLLPQRYTPRLVEQIVRLGTAVSFGEAHVLLREMVGAEVPPDTIRRLTVTAGRQALALETEEAAQPDRSLPSVLVVDRLQQVSVDGAMVPLVHGEWAEVKNLAIGRVEPTKDGPRARALSYFARLADHERFRVLAGLEFRRRATEEAGEVVAVSDGAEWIQGFLDEHCPAAVRIIDWSHAAGYVAQAGQALFGPGTAECSGWVGRQLHRLWTQDPQWVVAELSRHEATSGLDAVRSARQYLEKRVDQMTYARFRRGGYPVGSGIVESANKVVVEARLKGRGMHWARANVDPMLVLRCTAASGRWQHSWPQVRAQLRRPHRRRPLHSPPAPAPPAPSPTAALPSSTPVLNSPAASQSPRIPTIVNGKPTRAHPWNRYSACRAKT